MEASDWISIQPCSLCGCQKTRNTNPGGQQISFLIIKILFNFLRHGLECDLLNISTPAGNVNISPTFPPFDKQISQV